MRMKKVKPKSRENGFDASRSIRISTKELTKLQKALTNIHQLVANNQDISFGDPNYYLENLEQIKRELISKATQDAHIRAEEFAKTSNVKVGVLNPLHKAHSTFKRQIPMRMTLAITLVATTRVLLRKKRA